MFKNGQGLLVLKASVSLDAKADLPKRVKLLDWGSNATRYGNVIVNELTLAALPENQKRVKFDHVVLDFQHNTVPGTPHYKGEPAKVAARKGTPLVLAGEGLFVDNLDWTPDGAEHREHYPDLSATVKTNEKGEVIFLHSGALCRQGEVEGITLPLSADPFQPTEDESMKNILLMILGADPKSTDEQIAEAAKKFRQDITTLSQRTHAQGTGAAGGQGGEGVASLVTLSAQLTELDGKFKTLEAKLVDADKRNVATERQAMIDLAIRDGKLIPLAAIEGDKEKGVEPLDNGQLKALIATLDAGKVPLAQRTPENLKALAATGIGSTNSGTGDAVRSQLGISEDDWKKAK